MGLFGLFYFVLKCIKLLAWPSFALAYPLLPVWPYAKILAIFWWVMPRFNGASIAYDSLVRPCLSAHLLQVVPDLLNRDQDLSLKGESFLVVAQRYVDEHGTEALEKVISLKTKNIEPTFSRDDITGVEILNGNGTGTPAENKITTKLNSRLEENVQREWTCAVCQVTTTSEVTLKSHLKGRKHRTKCEELKAGKQTTKKGVTFGGPNRVRYCTICQVKTHSEETWNSHLQGKKHKAEWKELKEIVKAAKKNIFPSSTTKSNFAIQDPNPASSGGPSNKFMCANQDLKETLSSGGPKNRLGCDICQVPIQDEASLKSHLQGKKHKSNCELLKSKETTEKVLGESLSAVTSLSAPSANNNTSQNRQHVILGSNAF